MTDRGDEQRAEHESETSTRAASDPSETCEARGRNSGEEPRTAGGASSCISEGPRAARGAGGRAGTNVGAAWGGLGSARDAGVLLLDVRNKVHECGLVHGDEGISGGSGGERQDAR